MSKNIIIYFLLLVFVSGCTKQLNKEKVNEKDNQYTSKYEEIIDISKELSNFKDIKIRKVKVNNEKILFVNMKNYIYFDVNKYKIKNIAKLSNLIPVFLNKKNIKLYLVGHTDSKGNDHYNQLLSELRAKEVSKYLTKNGINPNIIDYIGYGEEQPISSNKNREGRRINRRVEIIISTTKKNADFFIEERKINNNFLNDHSKINTGKVARTLKGRTKNKSISEIEEIKKKVVLEKRSSIYINIQKRKHIINDN